MNAPQNPLALQEQKQPSWGEEVEKRNVSKAVGRVLLLDPRRIKPFPDNPRRKDSPGFTDESIRSLAISIKYAGQETAIVVFPIDDPNYDVELSDGERRLRACMLGKFLILAEIRERPGDREQHYISSVIANFGREGHTCIEIAYAIDRMHEYDQKRWTFEAIAAVFGKSTAWVYQHHSLLKLHPDVQRMLVKQATSESEEKGVVPEAENRRQKRRRKNRKLTLQLALILVPCPKDEQVRLAQEIVSKAMSFSAARRYILSQTATEQNAGSTQKTRRTLSGAEMFNRLDGFHERIEDGVGFWLDMNPANIKKIFAMIGQPKKQRLKERLLLLSTNIQTIAKLLD